MDDYEVREQQFKFYETGWVMELPVKLPDMRRREPKVPTPIYPQDTDYPKKRVSRG